MEHEPLWVADEGIPGLGKTTAMKMAAAQLRQKGYRVEIIDTDSSVTASIFKGEIKRLFKLGEVERTFLLFVVRRLQYRTVMSIKGLVDIVLLDRFWASTISWDHYGHSIPMSTIESAWKGTRHTPDMTLYYSGPLELARKRKPTSQTLEDGEFMGRVLRGYEAQRDADPEHWVTIDATLAIPEVADACVKAIIERVPREIKKRVAARNREERRRVHSS